MASNFKIVTNKHTGETSFKTSNTVQVLKQSDDQTTLVKFMIPEGIVAADKLSVNTEAHFSGDVQVNGTLTANQLRVESIAQVEVNTLIQGEELSADFQSFTLTKKGASTAADKQVVSFSADTSLVVGYDPNEAQVFSLDLSQDGASTLTTSHTISNQLSTGSAVVGGTMFSDIVSATTVRAVSFRNVSDVRVKSDVRDMESQWNEVRELRFRQYKMKNSTCKVDQYGVVAQEVTKTGMSGCVIGDASMEMLAIDNTNMSFRCFKALQEAIVRIECLEHRLERLMH